MNKSFWFGVLGVLIALAIWNLFLSDAIMKLDTEK